MTFLFNTHVSLSQPCDNYSAMQKLFLLHINCCASVYMNTYCVYYLSSHLDYEIHSRTLFFYLSVSCTCLLTVAVFIFRSILYLNTCSYVYVSCAALIRYWSWYCCFILYKHKENLMFYPAALLLKVKVKLLLVINEFYIILHCCKEVVLMPCVSLSTCVESETTSVELVQTGF